MPFTKVLDLCGKHGFLRKLSKNDSFILKTAPIGALLQETLRNEWLYSMVTNRDMTVLLNNDSFSETYAFVKEISLERPPFGIAEIIPNQCDDKSNNPSDSTCFHNFFRGENTYQLCCTNFISPANSTHFFHQWQRQRRTWWRKVCNFQLLYCLNK